MPEVNDQLVLISGESTGGKSASLMNLENPRGVIYMNCESGKKLPFPAKFKQVTITDPYTIYSIFDQAELPENSGKVHTLVIDSLTYMMDMFESKHVLPAVDTQKAWGQYQQFFKNLMQQYVAGSTKNVIFTAHALAQYNDSDKIMEKKVPVKGALKNTGIESYFSVVVAAKKMSLVSLEGYKNDLLTITPDDEALGFKYVFQTRLTKETVNERIRSPMGMWTMQETFIDNDVQLLMNRLREYYGTSEPAMAA